MSRSSCRTLATAGCWWAVLAVGPGSAMGEEVMIVSSGVHAPDTVYLSRHTPALERVPLDGVATWIATPVPIPIEGKIDTPRLANGRLARHASGADTADVGQTIVRRRRIPYEHIAPAIEDLKSASLRRFKSNFIHCITGNPLGPVNWFDDEWWDIVCHNIGMIAKAAKEGGCRGILIDPEDYSYSMWSYPLLTETQKYKTAYRRGNKEFYKGKTFDQVRAKVRQRGRDFSQHINAEFDDPILMFFHAVSYSAWQINDPRWDSLDETGFGLMVPFIDGMLEGSSDRTVIVDCTSQAKWWTDRVQMEAARKLIKQDARGLSRVPKLFDRKIRLGFCYRLDYHPREEEIQPGRPGGLFDSVFLDANYFTPDKLEQTLKLALEIGDGYILFWNYRANWWLNSVDARPADGAALSRLSR